jgi:hypothetical protein
VPELTRRALLVSGAGAMGVAVLGIGESAAAATSATSAPLRADYAKSVGKVFTAAIGSRTSSVKLVSIRDLSPTTAQQRPFCFMLVFAPTTTARLADGIYTLSRTGVPTHALFMSSIGSNGRMQLVVNRAV